MEKATESYKNLPKVEDLQAGKVLENKNVTHEWFPDPEDARIWFKDLTGDKADPFDTQTELLARQVNQFLVLNKTNHFPNEEMKSELYSLISKKLLFYLHHTNFCMNNDLKKTLL
jgi:hypothetical protein